jgi:putative endonuclease
MYYIYILYSATSDKYYTGYTSDYKLRLLQHNTQEHFNSFTSKHRPWKLAAVFECGTDRGAALKMERFIKKQNSRKLLQQLADPEFEPTGILAQLVRVPDVRD